MKSFLVLLFAFIFLVPSTYAQDENSFMLFLNVGGAVPLQPKSFDTYWNGGINAGTGALYRFSPMFTGFVSVDYSFCDLDDEKNLEALGITGADMTIEGGTRNLFSFLGNIKVSFVETVRDPGFTITGGLGYLSETIDDFSIKHNTNLIQTVVGTSDAGLQTYGSIGYEFPSGNDKLLFIQLGYGLAFTKNDNTGFLLVKIGLGIVP